MKTDKRDLILTAAEKLISALPYNEISVDTIAKKAGIGKGSIYYYFKSKDEIIYTVIEQSYSRATHEYFNSIHELSEISALKKIKKLFQSVIKREFADNEKNMIIALHLNDDIILHNKMKYAAIREISPILTELLKEGIREGSIITETPKETAEMIVAVLTFFLDDTAFPEDSVTMKNKLKIFAGVLEICLKTEPGSFDFLYNPLLNDFNR